MRNMGFTNKQNCSDEELLDIIKKQLSNKRWKHTVNVVKAAKSLALTWHVDEAKAEFSAYCHDYAKEFSDEESAGFIRKYHLPEKFFDYMEIAHGPVAAAILENVYGVADEDILNAVRYHTTGRANMSLLEKIVNLADLIEEGRDYVGVDEIRQLAYKDLDAACILAFEGVLGFVKRSGRTPDVDMLYALDYLQKNKERNIYEQ